MGTGDFVGREQAHGALDLKLVAAPLATVAPGGPTPEALPPPSQPKGEHDIFVTEWGYVADLHDAFSHNF